MSQTLLEFSKSFLNGRLTAEVFSEAYIEFYRIERDGDVLIKDNDALSQYLSTVFCLADLYYPTMDRNEYELDEEQLKMLIIEELKNGLNCF